MKAFGQLIVIGGFSVIAAGATYLIKGPPSRLLVCDPAALKPDEVCLQNLRPEERILWVDARTRNDWEKSGVEGSVLWNLDPKEDMLAFEAEAAPLIADASQVIVYCGDENCGISRQVAARIKALGMTENVRVLHGGWRALKEAGRTKDSNPAT